MGDCLQASILPRHVTSHPGQLSLLPSVAQKMSTSHSAVMHCSGESKAGWLIPFMDGDKRVVWVAGKKCVIPR